VLKRRILKPNQKVIIIYDSKIGFTTSSAIFKNYRQISIGSALHDIPVFDYQDGEITGLDCFWILPEEGRTPERIERLQYELIDLQIQALTFAKEKGYIVPLKIKDREIEVMAQENTDRLQSLIQKLGFDPRDASWIETELADGQRERNWFKFERENALMFASEWDDMTQQFNQQYDDSISVDEAKNLSKKRMRYLLGAYHIRMSGNADRANWKVVAKEFEQKHRDRENRMLTWTLQRDGKFPLARTKQPVLFFAGPYFAILIEKVPHLFTDTNCTYVKPGIILRVISYDPISRYIRLDFTAEIRKMIKGVDDPKPWVKDTADYDLWVKPEEVDAQLEFLENLV
jgi:hypothetical protein